MNAMNDAEWSKDRKALAMLIASEYCTITLEMRKFLGLFPGKGQEIFLLDKEVESLFFDECQKGGVFQKEKAA